MGWAARTHHSGEMKGVPAQFLRMYDLRRLAKQITTPEQYEGILSQVADPTMRDAVRRLMNQILPTSVSGVVLVDDD